MPAYTNIHGRRPGRGIRPWLLGPKVISVAIYFGALVAAAVVWGAALAHATTTSTPPVELLRILRLVFICAVVPGLVASIVFGVALFFQHPRQFFIMRWWRVKIVLIAVMLPTGHLFMSSRLIDLRRAATDGVYHESAMRQFGWGLLVLLTVSAVIIILGRLKPRLGQNWARAHARLIKTKPKIQPPDS